MIREKIAGPDGSFYTSKLFIKMPAFIRRYVYRIKFLKKLDVQIRQWLEEKRKDNSVILDLGANMGVWSDIFLVLGFQVYAYEPDLDCYKYLSARFYKNKKIKVFKAAVSDIEATLKLYMTPGREPGSLLNTQGSSIVKEKINIGRVFQEVPSFRISKIINELEPDFIKMDVEGAEAILLEDMLDHCRIELLESMFVAVETHEDRVPHLEKRLELIQKKIGEKGLKNNFSFRWI